MSKVSKYRENKKQQEFYQIQHLQQMLLTKQKEYDELFISLKNASTELDTRRYTFRLERTEQHIDKISSRLKNLGPTEKRGRPKKAEGEHYQEQRKKFTAHLQPETVTYLQALKADGSISNISAFLDELVAEHQKKNS